MAIQKVDNTVTVVIKIGGHNVKLTVEEVQDLSDRLITLLNRPKLNSNHKIPPLDQRWPNPGSIVAEFDIHPADRKHSTVVTAPAGSRSVPKPQVTQKLPNPGFLGSEFEDMANSVEDPNPGTTYNTCQHTILPTRNPRMGNKILEDRGWY